MTTYKGINGFAVQSVASDPSPLDEGQVWYNNATYAFKLAGVTTVGTWAAGGNLNTARFYFTGAGNQTATLAFGGRTAPAETAASESYNGTSWTNTPSMNTARAYLAGCGTQTAALGFGGYIFPGGSRTHTESWNGSSWTIVNPTNTARYAGAGSGLSTAGLYFGGDTNPPAVRTGATELWNGTSWTSNPNSMATARGYLAGAGTQTSAIAFGGSTGSASSATEEFTGPGVAQTKTITTS